MTLPFRLGSTSYVAQAGLVENATRLLGVVDDVELVLFDSPNASNLPDDATIRQLADVAGDRLTFSLHLPTTLRLVDPDPSARARSLDQAAALLERCHPLPLSSAIAHLDGGEPAENDPDGWELWRQVARDSLKLLGPLCAAPLCVENIERYAPEALLPIVASGHASLCLDVGHLWKTGRDPHPLLQPWLPQVPVIHLHGWDGTRDHRPLTTMPPEPIAALLHELARASWCGVLTLEVFEDDFWHSRQRLLEIGDWRLPPKEPISNL